MFSKWCLITMFVAFLAGSSQDILAKDHASLGGAILGGCLFVAFTMGKFQLQQEIDWEQYDAESE